MQHRQSKEEIMKIAEQCKNNIDELVKLYHETDPKNGPLTEQSKFNKAITALILSKGHIGYLTQWAEAQIIGYHQNLEADCSVNPDCHKHELTEMTSIPALRRAVSVILDKQLGSSIVGLNYPYYHPWRENLNTALQALNEGEVAEFLTPTKHKKFVNKYSTEKLRSAAVLHVYRLWDIAGSKKNALEIVACKISLSPESILAWEKSLLNRNDKDKSFRNSIREGKRLSLELEKEVKQLRGKGLKKSEEVAAYLDIRNSYDQTPALMHHDMLEMEFPLEHLGSWLRTVKG